jgi:hypothetical protein
MFSGRLKYIIKKKFLQLQGPWHFWALLAKFLWKKQRPEDICTGADRVRSAAETPPTGAGAGPAADW